ncbi:MAG: tRNA (guanine-N(1)-)-methyltransferase [Parcubacteria group bacterium GW2011_GWE2_39_37]|uniref:tRNA (guanine-N(1)-)-methyltransferase n=1 Tax=Candidatus Falkowbacteria bacterium GW2011_GWF2_39_8 TaxID=1618642 RepID=A0A0G0Q1B9_9BACT|nr:MAG: tRNA (guanine-N(1)-)-methyltransferase [Parcubacteria group bacterium GW2011_GWE2_39_37]KKR33963.1 MAG: tRNA (guanine-N(1)-)-methyltransferase [Candidatus Falkowbacteria bacterium GW2011_GWF2_39_8]
MHFHILSIFPNILDSYFNESILKRAQKNNVIKIHTHALRDWTTDKHKTVDDTPYGGGAGMVMKVEPIFKALKALQLSITNYQLRINTKTSKTKIILLSAKGKTWNQQLAKKYSKLDNIIFVCGRYEGIDERVKKFVDEEISIGDYVLTGGELGAAVIIDSIARLLPGALGNAASSVDESHSQPGVLEYPQYTKPDVFEADSKKLRVPKVLLSGHHAEINKWRAKQSKVKK